MRILIAASLRPFADASVRVFVSGLAGALQTHGHSVDQVYLPYGRSSEPTVEQSLAIRLTDVSHAGDLLIAIGAPCHLLRHPNAVVWYHQPWSVEGPLEPAELDALARARRVFAASEADAASLEDRGGIAAEVVYPVPIDPCPAEPGEGRAVRETGDYILVLDSQSEALASAAVDAADGALRLESADGASPENRIRLLGGALAVLDLTDSSGLGLTTVAGFRSARPVITVTDAGIAAEWVIDGENGRVVARSAQALEAAIGDLLRDRSRAEVMGRRGALRAAASALDSDTLVGRLLE